jgi:hypothetical protein
MDQSSLTFPLQHPHFLILDLLVFGVVVRIDLWAWGLVGVRVRPGARRAIWWGVLGGVALLPYEWYPPVLWTLIVLHLAAALGIGLVYASEWGRRTIVAPRMRRNLTRLSRSSSELSPVSRLPKLLADWRKSLAAYGFVDLMAGEQPGEVTRAILHRPGDGTIAAMTKQPAQSDRAPLPIVMLISVTEGGAGVLSTSLLSGPDVCPSTIAQVVRWALPPTLLATHEEGRRLLEDRGVRFERTAPEDAVGVGDRVWDELLSALLALPDASLLERRTQFRRPVRTVATMLEDPATLEWLAAVRAAAPTDEPSIEPVLRGSSPSAGVAGPSGRSKGGLKGFGRTLLSQVVRAKLWQMAESGLTLSPLVDPPAELEGPTGEFEALGFRIWAMGMNPMRSPHAILIGPDDDVVAEVVLNRKRSRPPTLELTSFVEGTCGAGTLNTASRGVAEVPSMLLVRQVVPGASPGALLAAHDDGVRYLVSREIPFERVRPEDVEDRISRVFVDACRAWLSLSGDEYLESARATAAEAQVLPAIAADPSVAARIDALIALRREDRAEA